MYPRFQFPNAHPGIHEIQTLLIKGQLIRFGQGGGRGQKNLQTSDIINLCPIRTYLFCLKLFTNFLNERRVVTDFKISPFVFNGYSKALAFLR